MAIFDENGYVKDSYDALLQKLKDDLQLTGVITDSSSPNENLLNIITTTATDIQDNIEKYVRNCDPRTAFGIGLDRLVGINNIIRRGGTFSTINIDITTDRALTLQGLDNNINSINGTGYTVADNIGQRWILSSTQNIASAGTYSLQFRAEKIGAINSQANTIINPITVVLGVLSVNNPLPSSNVGTTEELDPQLKQRRERSFLINAQSYLESIVARLLNESSISDVAGYENITNFTDADGIPAHSIWIIVDGGSDSLIASILNTTKSLGCGYKGDVVYNITNSNGTITEIRFDRPNEIAIYANIDIKNDSGNPIDTTALTNYIETNLLYKLNATAAVSQFCEAIVKYFNTFSIKAYPIDAEISDDNITFVKYLDSTSKQNKWVVSASNININYV